MAVVSTATMTTPEYDHGDEPGDQGIRAPVEGAQEGDHEGQNFKMNKWAGGITREVCILPAEESSLQDRNFELRVSSAVINTTESTFSDFTGFTRLILCWEL